MKDLMNLSNQDIDAFYINFSEGEKMRIDLVLFT